MKNYLGVDIGGTAVKTGIVTEEGAILTRVEMPVPPDPVKAPILETTSAALRALSAAEPALCKILAGCGVSATGEIDTDTGVVIGSSGSVPGYLGTRIADHLAKETGLPVRVANDGCCALLGECWTGAAAGEANVVLLTIGTGVGGGVLCGGHLVAGKHGLGTEVGHIILRGDGELCTCGNRGCLEHYASTTALVREVRTAVEDGRIPASLFPDGAVNGRTIFAALQSVRDFSPVSEDETTVPTVTTSVASEAAAAAIAALRDIVSDWQNAISDGVISLVHIFAPDVVLLGGGVSGAGEAFIGPIRERVLTKAMPVFRDGLRVLPASLSNDAGLIGAVRNFIESGMTDAPSEYACR